LYWVVALFLHQLSDLFIVKFKNQKMNLGTSIVGIIVILICSIPFVLMSINSKKKRKELLKYLLTSAATSNCKITKHDLWNSSSIGIDEEKQVVFFTMVVDFLNTAEQIALSEIQQCRVLHKSRTINNENGNFEFTDKLDLAFKYRDKSKADLLFTFYNADFDSLSLSGELQLVEKWCKISNDAISKINK
jgi:ABC-type glycerol-3-phosphate transport system permease component